MKVRLMFKDRDFSIKASLEKNKDFIDLTKDLIEDLELENIIKTMGSEDELVESVCRFVLLSPLQNISDIKYRQDIQKDSFKYPEIVRQLYNVCLETKTKQRNSWYILSSTGVASTFSSAVGLLRIYTEGLIALRKIADHNLSKVKSEGLLTFFKMMQTELSDEYFSELKKLLAELNESDGTLISAKFGNYLQGVNYIYRRKNNSDTKAKWLFAPSYTIPERDNESAEDMSWRRGRAINEATNALAQAAEHLKNFFFMLQQELAFYVGSLNLYEKITSLGMPMCIPEIGNFNSKNRDCLDLYDISLALLKNSAVIGNRLSAENKQLYIITGANQGGKTTFLRSVGQSQLMSQCGLFVCAKSFNSPLRKKIFTHFKKEEDSAMNSGKLDEEMNRMNIIVNSIQSDSLILFNESFSSTNEREGSEIFKQITKALIENNIEVFSVTHLYTYAIDFLENNDVLYLRAEHLAESESNKINGVNGKVTFKIIPGKPLNTAYGEDIYNKVFG